ncbi:hypothetical protein IAR55_005634 [Kwoniella newhampshirensis]|uniref:SET domain-containing protein n=1 Tax=Kwoniella newhampshirensis TaxID=1651941 RepID=A0AAW0YV90_9TREE
MDLSLEAGPSRPSPSRSSPYPLQSPAIDVVMEDVSASIQADTASTTRDPDEAVQLLLNISAVADPSPLFLGAEAMDANTGETPLVPKPAPPDLNVYPYTPPEESNDRDRHHSSERERKLSNQPPSASVSLPPPVTSDPVDEPPVRPSTPSHTSPEPPATKTKQKRKRNATAGPSRRASGDRPQHWLGEDNTVIRCICGFTEDDGFTIQCEECGAWEHGMCFGYLDEASAPDTYFCELCRPRPVDAVSARQAQEIALEQQRQARAAAVNAGDNPSEKEKPRSKGGKPRRPRTESVIEAEIEPKDVGGKERSPSVMGPPPTKPKRRQGPGKPRGKQSTIESTPGPLLIPQLVPDEPEDDYFRVEPWALEYTPLKENMIRGKTARQIMRNVYKEWVDAEEEMVATQSKAIHTPSGLPSPTETGVLRLSPEHLFPPPDFNILAPPVPPVFLSGSNLETLGTPTSVQSIEDAPSFLPLTYAESLSNHGVYTRPTIYGVFADEPATMGAFIGEFRGEVLDCETYRRDPINQYAALGLPKPHVRSIGPPINLMIDARGYGCDLRFVRSGCHPNVVLRPLIWRSSEHEAPKLKFGLFAAKDISKMDELVLGWEWDDQHVVHSLRSAIHTAMLTDGTLASPAYSTSQKTIYALSKKFDAVLTHIFGTFSSCACVVPGACALAQMGQVVDARSMQGLEAGGKKKMRVDLGELVGAVRGWRRREIEEDGAKKWQTAEMLDLRLTRSRTSEVDEVDVETEHQLESRMKALDGSISKQDDLVEVDQSEVEQYDLFHPTSPLKVPSSATGVFTLGLENSAATASTSQLSPKSAVERMASSSSLSSAASSIKPSLPDDNMDSGSESDATTATIPKSEFSDSELEDEANEEAEEDDEEVPAQGRPFGNARKVKRALSPVLEIESGSRFFDSPMSEDEEREMVVNKSKRQRINKALHSSPIASHMKKAVPQTKGKRMAVVGAKTNGTPVVRRARQKRIVSSPVSDDESMDVDDKMPSRRRPSSGTTKHVTSSPRSGKSIKLEQLESVAAVTGRHAETRAVVPDETTASTSLAVEPSIATAPDTVVIPPPLSEVEDSSQDSVVEPKGSTPPGLEPTPPPKELTPPPPEPPKKVSLLEYLKNHKIRKESQTPLITPAAENPPKMVDLPSAGEAIPVPSGPGSASVDNIPGFGNAAATASAAMSAAPSIITTSISLVKTEPEMPSTISARLNLFEHLPSSRSTATSATPTATLTATPLATPTPSSSYVPRQTSGEYFPPQPHLASFVPRVSSSFVPRTASIPSETESALPPPAATSYIPRSGSVDEQYSPLKTVAAEMPPPLASREPPPHTPIHTTPSSHKTALPAASTPIIATPNPPRAPPTGPKVPPTGPRGLGLAPGGPLPVPGAGGRGAFGTPRGGFGGRGVWRGRGGFRGGWRGN